MDKKTMLVVLGCLIAFIGWQQLVNKLYPPKPKPARALVATAASNAVPQAQVVSATEKPVEAAGETAVEPEESRLGAAVSARWNC